MDFQNITSFSIGVFCSEVGDNAGQVHSVLRDFFNGRFASDSVHKLSFYIQLYSNFRTIDAIISHLFEVSLKHYYKIDRKSVLHKFYS
jgi:hypothetical protein